MNVSRRHALLSGAALPIAAAATATPVRAQGMGMAAADRIPVLGYHMPFPAMGFVDTRGDGFHYVPVSYQFMMG